MIELENIAEGKHIETEDGCKKIKNWAFKSQNYCTRGNCDVKLVIVFKDGTKRCVDELNDLSNC